MKQTATLKMKFSCSQNWDDMKISPNGRHCTACDNEVLDLTGRSFQEIIDLKKEKGKVCGMVRAEQLEQDLIPIEMPGFKKIRYAAATLVAFLGIEISTAKAQEKKENKIEQAEPSKGAVDIVNMPVCPKNEVLEEPVVVNHHRKPFLVTNNNRWYFSRRFPFIKRRSRHVLGAMF